MIVVLRVILRLVIGYKDTIILKKLKVFCLKTVRWRMIIVVVQVFMKMMLRTQCIVL